MDSRIAVMTTSRGVKSKLERVFARQGEAYPVILSRFERIVDDAGAAVERGAKVFISRGRSATLLKENFDLPVVALRFTYYDFVLAIQEAQRYSNRIAVIGYMDSWFYPLEQYRDNLSNLRTLYFNGPDELDGAMELLCREGIEVIVAGQTAAALGRRHGLRTVCIGLEDSSVHDSSRRRGTC